MGAITIGCVALVGGAPVAQAQYPPTSPPRLEVEPRLGFPNYPFVATVFNCLPNEPVTFNLLDVAIPTVCNPTTLQASTPMVAPPVVGTYQVTADLFGTPTALVSGIRAPAAALVEQTPRIRLVLADTIEVINVAPSTTTTTIADGGLATTGSNGVSSTLMSALVLVAAGIAVFVVSRVRRRPAPN
jgi:hypothetical protein